MSPAHMKCRFNVLPVPITSIWGFQTQEPLSLLKITWSDFSKENFPFFPSLPLSLSFPLVFQFCLPPLAEILICTGQNVFSSLALLHAAALLHPSQWQWRGAVVSNLLSYTPILCLQVINLCMLHAPVCCPLPVSGGAWQLLTGRLVSFGSGMDAGHLNNCRCHHS